MSDINSENPTTAQDTTITIASSPATATAGAILRQNRESAGLHISTLSGLLKVPVSKLEALEDNRLDLLPDIVFTRALTSSICKHLKIEASPILALLPQISVSSLKTEDDGLKTQIKEEAEPLSFKLQRLKEYLFRNVLLMFAPVVLLIAIIIYFKPELTQWLEHNISYFNQSQTEKINSSTKFENSEHTSNLENQNHREPVLEANQANKNNKNNVSAINVSNENNTPINHQENTQNTISANSLNNTETNANNNNNNMDANSSNMIFTAQNDVWVKVVDSKTKRSVFQKTIKAGESVPVPLTNKPLSVVIGKSDAIKVVVKGQDFDLKPVTQKDNIARFDIK